MLSRLPCCLEGPADIGEGGGLHLATFGAHMILASEALIAELRRDNEILQSGMSRLVDQLKALESRPLIQRGETVTRLATTRNLVARAGAAKKNDRLAWYFDLHYMVLKLECEGNPVEEPGGPPASYVRMRRLVLMSGLFDGDLYLTTNPDVARASFAAIDHFLQFSG